jgi:hypothetical protein
MSLKSLLKAVTRALPAIAANAPALIVAVQEVTKAVKKPPSKADAAAPGIPAPRGSAPAARAG